MQETNPDKMIYLFVDTNVLLHYRRLEEIDWCGLSLSTEVAIVLCPAVVRELDHHKVSHPQKKIRKRAQDVISSLHSRISGAKAGTLRNGVHLEFLTEDPDLDFVDHKLRTELPDDWLIASCLVWMQRHPSSEVKIVSGDLGLSIKAKARGISAFAPAETDKLAEELDADEKKIAQLQKELAEIRNVIPKLALCFWHEGSIGDFLKFPICPPKKYNLEGAAKTLKEVEANHPFLLSTEKPGGFRLPEIDVIRRQLYGKAYFPIKNEDVDRYNLSLQRYYQSYDAYLRRMHDLENQNLLLISFEIGIENDGGVPADDVDIHLHYPDGFQLFDGDDYSLESPKPPVPPSHPWTVDYGLNSSSIHNLDRIWQPRSAIPPVRPVLNVSTPFIKKTNSYDVRSHINKVKHGYVLRVAKFSVLFDSYESACPFKIQYSISAANMPKPANGELSIVVEKGGAL